jgi:hypothetical protein
VLYLVIFSEFLIPVCCFGFMHGDIVCQGELGICSKSIFSSTLLNARDCGKVTSSHYSNLFVFSLTCFQVCYRKKIIIYLDCRPSLSVSSATVVGAKCLQDHVVCEFSRVTGSFSAFMNFFYIPLKRIFFPLMGFWLLCRFQAVEKGLGLHSILVSGHKQHLKRWFFFA